MHEYPRWKYVLIALTLLLGVIYVLPNAFPQDPSVQVSGGRTTIVDAALKERVQGVLEAEKLPFKSIELNETEKRLLVRLNSSEDQEKAQAKIDEALEDGYNVALNMANTVPGWLTAIHARPMTLGLDLQGGVHFLMEVDQKTTEAALRDRLRDDVATLLRENSIGNRLEPTATGMMIFLRSEADRDNVFGRISRDVPQLEVKDGPVSEGSWGLIADIKPTEVRAAMTAAVEKNTTTLRNRLNAMGTSEPSIQRQGESRIVVQLPGLQDSALAKRRLGSTATLEYRAVNENATNAYAATQRVPPDSKLYTVRETQQPIVLLKKVIASGSELDNAVTGFDQRTGEPIVSVTLNATGGRRMADFTADNVGRRMAVVYRESEPVVTEVDGKKVVNFKVKEDVISAATIQGHFGKNFQTSGLGREEASELALLLKSGSLAAPVAVVEERTVGPSLGKENIAAGLKATIAGFTFVLVFMGIYYRVFGLIAGFALIANTVLLGAALSVFGATLTMPGIAALLLTVGMAVDANVLICERVREELRLGNTPLASIHAGYDKAWHTIVDANVTHLLAGIALLAFGSGPIRGFAFVLVAGILTSMFTAVTVSQGVTFLIYGGRRKLKTLSV